MLQPLRKYPLKSGKVSEPSTANRSGYVELEKELPSHKSHPDGIELLYQAMMVPTGILLVAPLTKLSQYAFDTN